MTHSFNAQVEIDRVRQQAELDKVEVESRLTEKMIAMGDRVEQYLGKLSQQQPLHHVTVVQKQEGPKPPPPAAPLVAAAPPGPTAAEYKQALQEMMAQNGRAMHEIVVHTGKSFGQLFQQIGALRNPVIQNFSQTLLQDNRSVQQTALVDNRSVHQTALVDARSVNYGSTQGQQPGSSSDGGAAVAIRAKAPEAAKTPKAPAAASPLPIEDRKRAGEQAGKTKKLKIAIQDVPIEPKPARPPGRKIAIKMVDKATKSRAPSNNELNEATKEAVQRILRNRPTASKQQIITRNVAGLQRELEQVLEETSQRRTGMTLRDMEVRRGVRA